MAPNQVAQHQPGASSDSEGSFTELKPRNYQDEILKSCIERNTIIYLPTGAGKTYIAVMALQHFAKPLEKTIAEGGKRSVFLTHRKALALQQAEVITGMTSLEVCVYTGDMNVDAWDQKRWTEEFEKAQVIVATVQIILNLVLKGYIKISDFNLMIFDECHNAQKDHPFVTLMAKFSEYSDDEHPRVIGLSGMLTASTIKPTQLIDDLSDLEAKFRATIKTAHGELAGEVRKYSTCAKEELIPFDENRATEFQDAVAAKLENLKQTIRDWPLSDREDDNLKAGNKFDTFCDRFKSQLRNLGLYGGALANLATVVDMEMKKRETSNKTIQWIFRALITTFEEIQHMIMKKMYDSKVYEITASDNDPTVILSNSSPHVQELLKFTRRTFSERPNTKGLIFVKERFTARILCHVVRRYFSTDDNKHLNVTVDFMVGCNANMPESIETIIENQNNKEVLNKFRRGLTNLIVSTNVLEEGIDLQDCNMVISYDAPPHFGAYVQTKGRARMKDSIYAIMAPTNEVEKLKVKKSEWDTISKLLEEYLVKRAVDRPPPEQENIDKINERKFNESFKSKNGVTCDYRSANQFLNQYCAGLPKDRFTDSLPQWEDVSPNKSINDDFIVKITLPIQSPVKEEFYSKPMPSLKLARRSASYNAVKRLYDCGELTENLKPFDREERLERFDDVYFKTWTDYKQDNPLAGTKKVLRTYDITVPAQLKGSMPKINVQCYLYELLIQPNFQIPEAQLDSENIRVFHQLLKTSRSYSILTTKPLPRMSLMKFYQSFGEITCQVAYKPVEIKLGNANKLQQLKRFHCVLFRDILPVWKKFFVYDHVDSVIVVPTLNGNIDWHIVERFKSWLDLQKKSIERRKAEKYDESDWKYSVVCPWYRDIPKLRYVVTEVASHLTPNSPFPDLEKFPTYAEYTLKTYPSIQMVVNRRQFLIGVKPMTSTLNRLHAGDGEDGQRRATQTRGPEYLIPELCHNFRYPGDLWLKAIILPSALHRITYMLHAESLRIKINDYVGLKVVNYEPRPLIDKMARNKQSYKPDIHNPIIHPRMEDSEAKEVTIDDIVPFDDQHIGNRDEEPLDLERHFDSVTEIDINYYFKYINRDLAALQLNSRHGSARVNVLSPTQFRRPVPALCDVPDADQMRISVLAKPSTRGIEQHEMLAAITSSSAGDVFHNEILEVLGDAFLKFSVSLYLIQRHINWHEGDLTTIKGQIVGNRNLCYSAIRHGITGMMKTEPFNPENDWQPPMLKVPDLIQEHMRDLKIRPDLLHDLILDNDEVESGEPSTEKLYKFLTGFLNEPERGDEKCSTVLNFLGLHQVKDKACADTIEAILGTCVKTIGIERTFKVLEMFEIVPRGDDDISNMLQKKLRSPRMRTDISNEEVDDLLVNYKILEQSIGYTFKDRAYLLQALTHPTYPSNRVTGCYQQLEFLGDAVLDFLITAYITEHCSDMNPGKLTDLRSALVNNVTLACLCVRYNMHVHIKYQSSLLSDAIRRFVDFQQKENHQISKHLYLLMSESDVDNMTGDTDVPKALGDVFESIIGAVFLDSGNDLEKTWKVIYRLMKNELDEFMVNVPIQPVRQLHEHESANPEFSEPVINDKLVCVNVRFTCDGEICSINGIGANKKNAKRAAAKLALAKLMRT